MTVAVDLPRDRDLEPRVGGWDENSITKVVRDVAYEILRPLLSLVGFQARVFEQHRLEQLTVDLWLQSHSAGGTNTDQFLAAFEFKNMNSADGTLWVGLAANDRLNSMLVERKALILQVSLVSSCLSHY
jgi:hypothetical protein